MIDINANKERFENLCRTHITRPGLDKLLEWLEKSDFYTAPASAKYHLAETGGLCLHSLNVFDELVHLRECYGNWINISNEQLAITALFHDLCKVNFYKPDTRNVKVDGVWQTVPTYSYEEKFVYGGHGSKSVFLIERFMKLTPEEAVAINCHMASWDGNKDVGSAYEHYPSAWLLHVADEAATFLDENERVEK